jgi:hypothetical protein
VAVPAYCLVAVGRHLIPSVLRNSPMVVSAPVLADELGEFIDGLGEVVHKVL